MLKIGDKITVRYSKQLANAGKESLINKSGTVTKIVSNGSYISGAYVDIKIMRRTRNYFIPLKSIESLEDVNKARVFGLLKTTVL